MARRSDGIVRLRVSGQKGDATAQITVPAFIARNIPMGTQFAAELTDEGLLYRPIAVAEETVDDLPSWVQDLQTEDGDG